MGGHHSKCKTTKTKHMHVHKNAIKSTGGNVPITTTSNIGGGTQIKTTTSISGAISNDDLDNNLCLNESTVNNSLNANSSNSSNSSNTITNTNNGSTISTNTTVVQLKTYLTPSEVPNPCTDDFIYGSDPPQTYTCSGGYVLPNGEYCPGSLSYEGGLTVGGVNIGTVCL